MTEGREGKNQDQNEKNSSDDPSVLDAIFHKGYLRPLNSKSSPRRARFVSPSPFPSPRWGEGGEEGKFQIFLDRIYIKRGRVERDHKPSSVIPTPLLSGNREDGHLSRVLIAQGLKRPHPFRLCPEAIASRQT